MASSTILHGWRGSGGGGGFLLLPSDPYRCKDFFGGKYVLLCVGITASAAAAVATAWGLTRQRAKNPRLTDYTDDEEAMC